MTKHTRDKWAARIREWRESGKSIEDFVADKDYAASTLRWAISQLGVENDTPAAPKPPPAPAVKRPTRRISPAQAAVPRFAPVRVRRRAVPDAEMVVEVGGARIRVSRGADLILLGDVVRALQAGGR